MKPRTLGPAVSSRHFCAASQPLKSVQCRISSAQRGHLRGGRRPGARTLLGAKLGDEPGVGRISFIAQAAGLAEGFDAGGIDQAHAVAARVAKAREGVAVGAGGFQADVGLGDAVLGQPRQQRGAAFGCVVAGLEQGLGPPETGVKFGLGDVHAHGGQVGVRFAFVHALCRVEVAVERNARDVLRQFSHLASGIAFGKKGVPRYSPVLDRSGEPPAAHLCTGLITLGAGSACPAAVRKVSL
jgi:hypothetical protein